MESQQIFILLGAVVVAAVCVYLIVWRCRVARIRGTKVLIGEAMIRRGITPADAEAAGRGTEIFNAAQRCAVCAMDSICRDTLSAIARKDLPGECPNRALFDDIAAHKASIKAPDPEALDKQPVI